MIFTQLVASVGFGPQALPKGLDSICAEVKTSIKPPKCEAFKAESFSEPSIFKTLSSKVLVRFSFICCFYQKTVSLIAQFALFCKLKAITDPLAGANATKNRESYQNLPIP